MGIGRVAFKVPEVRVVPLTARNDCVNEAEMVDVVLVTLVQRLPEQALQVFIECFSIDERPEGERFVKGKVDPAIHRDFG